MTKGQCNCEKIRSSTPTASSDSVDSTAKSSSIDLQQHLYDEEEIIRRKLSLRTYHLPGNNWGQDWLMYFKNNHLVFGLCCHHRLHPVTTKHRLIILLGSLAFGLTVTNAVYLYYLYGDANYYDTAFALSISLSGEVVDNLPRKNASLDISNGMAVLWTIGASAHAMFDLSLWHMIACGCCQQRKLNHAGWHMAIAVVSIFVALASFVVLYRAYEVDESNVEEQLLVSLGGVNSTAPIRPITFETILPFGQGKPDFNFLYGYLVELFASLFVFTPIIQAILFSGILGCCGRIPLVGGRPRSIASEKERVHRLATVQMQV